MLLIVHVMGRYIVGFLLSLTSATALRLTGNTAPGRSFRITSG